MYTYNIFHLQFHNCYLLFEYKPFTQTVQNIMPFKTVKTIQISHFEFLSNCRFLKEVVCGTYDYIAQTRKC